MLVWGSEQNPTERASHTVFVGEVGTSRMKATGEWDVYLSLQGHHVQNTDCTGCT